jgi:glutamate transport system substrate-binding protein
MRSSVTERARRPSTPVAVALAIALLSACTSSAPTPAAPAATDRPAASPAPTCSSSSAVVVGVKVDQYGTGYLDVRNYSYQGFDVDVADYISGKLFNNANPYFLPVSSDTREAVLASCAVRFFAATYTTTAERQQRFDVAAPYLVTFQGVMVRHGGTQINTVSDLVGKRVCVMGNGSLTEDVLRSNVPHAIPVEADSYSACLNELRAGTVDAFSTDLAILYGYLTDPANTGLDVVRGLTIGDPIYYGLAFRKSDHALCLRAAAAISTMIASKQWVTDLRSDLLNYVTDEGSYPAPLQPTGQELAQNSCV